MGELHPSGCTVEKAQVVVHEADHPDLFGDLTDDDGLAGKDLAEVDLSAIEGDAVTAGDR